MADYTRYRTRPDDMPRHGRARRQKTTARKKRKLLWLKITAVVVLLLVIIVLGMAAGAIFALSRNLPSLEDLRKRPNAVNTTIYDRHGALIAELHGAENRVLVTSKGIPEVMKQATVATEDARFYTCLLYTSDAADEEDSVDLGGRRIIKKKKKQKRINK